MMTDVVAAMLREAGLTNVFSVPVSASICAEPIVVVLGDYERLDEVADGERGQLLLRVLCVRNVLNDASDVASRCRAVLRAVDWERWATAGDVRICGIDVGYPQTRGRDGSGRWIVELEVALVVTTDDE